MLKKFLIAALAAGMFFTNFNFTEAANVSDEKKAVKIVQTAGRDSLGDFAPDFARYNDDILFGEVWSRNDILSLHDRSIVTVSALVSSGILNSSLKYHIESAKKNGVTKDEMVEIITQLGFYAGWPKRWRKKFMRAFLPKITARAKKLLKLPGVTVSEILRRISHVITMIFFSARFGVEIIFYPCTTGALSRFPLWSVQEFLQAH